MGQNADLNLSGTPSLIAKSGYKLVLGTAGDQDIDFVRNGTVVASITSTGFVIADFKLNNNTYLQSKDAAGTGEVNLLKADASDNTVLNAETGKNIQLAINGTAEVTVSDDLIAFSGTTGTVQSAGSLVFKASGDAQRVLTFSGSSDTALSLTFGDATANQVLSIGSLTANGTDNATVHISAATNSAARSPFISIFGNQVASDGGKLLISAGSEGADGRLIILTPTSNPMQFYTNNALRWAINGSTGDLGQDATNGGSITMTKASTSIALPTGATLTAAGSSISDALQLTAVYNCVTTAAASTGVKLWAATVGTTLVVKNQGLNTIVVYPPDASGVIDDGSAGAGVNLGVGTEARFTITATNTWRSSGAQTTSGYPIIVHAAGTVYSLTATSAAVDFGTTDPGFTIAKAGRYRLGGTFTLKYSAATFAASRAVTMKLRRTNNTAGDISNSTIVLDTDIITTLTYTFIRCALPDVIYTTANTNDAIALFGDVAVLPTAGSLDVTAASVWYDRLL